jgi:hypothetical protein
MVLPLIDSIDTVSPFDITAKFVCSPMDDKNSLIDVTTAF